MRRGSNKLSKDLEKLINELQVQDIESLVQTTSDSEFAAISRLMKNGSLGEAEFEVVESLITRNSLVPMDPFLPNSTFNWIGDLESSWKAIRAELDRVLVHHSELLNFQDISVDQALLTTDDRWKTYFFCAYGLRSEANCARCPETARLLDAIPGLTTAFFSILSPGKHLPIHRGPYKGVLRYHLGLKIPEPTEACGIKVDGQLAHWKEGESLVFDDTYLHEAWNDTDDLRVVLFLDVLRPLPSAISWLNSFVIKVICESPFVQGGIEKEMEWEKKFEQLMAQPAETEL